MQHVTGNKIGSSKCILNSSLRRNHKTVGEDGSVGSALQLGFIHQQPGSLSTDIAPERRVQGGEELIVTFNVYDKNKTKPKQHIHKTRDDLHVVHKVPSELVQLEQTLVI